MMTVKKNWTPKSETSDSGEERFIFRDEHFFEEELE
jgi:hypothetical protein